MECTCNTEMEFVQGENIFESRLEQYHCPKCHRTIVINRTNGHIREGTLSDRY